MRRRVLITRPEPGASRTAKRLAAFGCEPVLLPLTEIRPLPAELPGEIAFDAVAVSSANALRHAQPALLRRLRGAPVFAVGRRTAEAASGAGLAPLTVGPGEGEGLAALMARRIAPGSRVVYLCGRVRSPAFETVLKAASIPVLPVETYDTAVIDYSDEALRASFAGRAVDTVLLYSRIAAEAFLNLTGRSVAAPWFGRSAFICMSQRVADAIAPLGKERVLIAATPDEEAMLALLGR
jgi:uroporphyrinogen-III synthase